ncbi:hypothetical protein CK203_065962 [Vitis vinifera]|uniref:Integrase zinc-binding domain-containing protein n=1 Tax=Vitis vinifera TaxID=29760 RepID=A0A438FNK7_VITVI|nr:hypothetical protein CK203_065962 [Vitis vinifera]
MADILFTFPPCIPDLLKAKDFKALVLHVSELSIALPWIPNNSPQSHIALASTAKDRRALRQLATRFVICGDALYRRSPDGLLLLCRDRASTDRVMREVHAGVCGPHIGGHMLAHKIMRIGYFWLTMETELWGIDIIGKISPKSSNGHEYILVAIDYFTKSEVDTLIQEYGIQHHKSSAYRTIPYSLVYGMEAVLPVEIEMGSLRVALEQHISEAYKRKMARAFRRRVKPRKFQKGDQVLRALRGLISDLRGKFRPTWSEPYVIRDLTRDGVACLEDLDGNQFTEPVNVD